MKTPDSTSPNEPPKEKSPEKKSRSKLEHRSERNMKKERVRLTAHILQHLGGESQLRKRLGLISIHREVDDEHNPVLIITYQRDPPSKIQKRLKITYDYVLQLYWVEFGVIHGNEIRRTNSYVGLYLERWKDLLVDEE